MIILDLPYPPSINNYWMTSGHRRYISKRGVEFRKAVWVFCQEWRVRKLGDQAVMVHIVLRPRSKKLMDIDNCAKAILDSLEHAGIITSDVQVERLVIERGQPVKGGGCRVLIEVMSSDSSELSLSQEGS
jgi:crossover junction endodeoxyribonuclease RusA